MWQAPNQRARALANAKKRERERARRPMHLKRVVGQLRITAGPGSETVVTQTRVMLSDFSPKGMGLFTSQPILVGQEVSLTLQQPKQFFVRGRIVWCQEYAADSHVLSQNAYSYRIGIEFIFDTKQEEDEVRAYCAELQKKHVFTVKAA